MAEDLARAAVGGPASDSAPVALERELLVLWLDADAYAVPVERVREIVRLRPITPVPRVPGCVAGVISLRGEVVQVVDLRVRLGLPPLGADAAARTRRIVVLQGEDGHGAGLLVDRVSEVRRVGENALRPASGRRNEAVVALVAGGDRFVSLFDVDRLLDLGGA